MTTQTQTRLIDRARNGYQIRAHGDVYQVIRTPFRPTSTPVFTSRSLEAARADVQRRAK